MSDEYGPGFAEKSRLCPSCRMSISVLATKCRYCGEEVGKPKDESRRLSTEDLGGETIVHRPTTESVMEALAAFRAEEEASMSESSDRSTRGTKEPASSSDPGLPELNEESQGLASIESGASFKRQDGPRKGFETTWKQRLVPIAAAVAGLMLVLFGGVAGAAWLQEYLENRNRVPEVTFFNQAPALIAQGADPIKVLDAAAEAFRHVRNDENKKIVEEAQQAVVKQFYGYLDADDWSMQKISEASVLAAQALALHPSTITTRLKYEGDEENSLYRMMLKKVDAGAGTATFSLNNPDTPSITVETNDVIEDRFIVKRISNRSVRVEDTRRRNSRGQYRIITYQVNTLLH